MRRASRRRATELALGSTCRPPPSPPPPSPLPLPPLPPPPLTLPPRLARRFADKKREPGNVGFDPLHFGDNPDTRARLELAELKNGRLAMLGFSGMLHQIFVTGKPIFASLQDIFAAP